MKTIYKDINGEIHDAEVIDVSLPWITLKYGGGARIRVPFEDLMLCEVNKAESLANNPKWCSVCGNFNNDNGYCPDCARQEETT